MWWGSEYYEYFMSWVEMFEIEYVEKNKSNPPWYYYIIFVFQTLMFGVSYVVCLVDLELQKRYKGPDSVTAISSELLLLTYEWQQQAYKLHLPISRLRTVEFVNAEAGDGGDVSKQIQQFLGPLENWHGVRYTPASFGHESLTLTKMSSSTFEVSSKTFGAQETLVL